MVERRFRIGMAAALLVVIVSLISFMFSGCASDGKPETKKTSRAERPQKQVTFPAKPKAVLVLGAGFEQLPVYGELVSGLDAIAAELEKRGVACEKFYTPNAIWSGVCRALQGACIVIYAGHGAGYDGGDESREGVSQDDKNGFNLDGDASFAGKTGDGSERLGGWISRKIIREDVSLAPNALVIINGACYSDGKTDPELEGYTPVDLVNERIEQYSETFLPLSSAYFADRSTDNVKSLLLKMIDEGKTLGEARDEIASEWTAANAQIITDVVREEHPYPGEPGRLVEFTHFRWSADSGYQDGTNGTVAVAAGDLGLRAADLLGGEVDDNRE